MQSKYYQNKAGYFTGAGINDAAASLSGEENADEMYIDNDGNTAFTANNAGGILGGSSSGQDIIVRFAVKPTSSILSPRQTIDTTGQAT